MSQYPSPYSPPPYGYNYYSSDPYAHLRAPAKQAGILMIILGALFFACGTCTLGVARLTPWEQLPPEAIGRIQELQAQIDVPLQRLFTVVGIISLVPAIALIVLGLFVRRGGVGGDHHRHRPDEPGISDDVADHGRIVARPLGCRPGGHDPGLVPFRLHSRRARATAGAVDSSGPSGVGVEDGAGSVSDAVLAIPATATTVPAGGLSRARPASSAAQPAACAAGADQPAELAATDARRNTWHSSPAVIPIARCI